MAEFVTAPMDEFQITASKTGTYAVCLQNSPDTDTSKDTKTVMLAVHVGMEHLLKDAASVKDAAVSEETVLPPSRACVCECGPGPLAQRF